MSLTLSHQVNDDLIERLKDSIGPARSLLPQYVLSFGAGRILEELVASAGRNFPNCLKSSHREAQRMWISSIKSVELLSLILLLDTSASTNQERKTRVFNRKTFIRESFGLIYLQPNKGDLLPHKLFTVTFYT